MSWKAVVSALLAGFAPWLATRPSSAQWVDVSSGGVHVRAPFVSVDVYRGGGVSVRAPYAAIDTGPPRYFGPPTVIESSGAQYLAPTQSELAAMDDQTLHQTIKTNYSHLRSRLTRFKTGYVWQQYLRPPDETTRNSSDGGAIAYQADLSRLLERFRQVSANERYHKLSQLPEFAALQNSLLEAESRDLGVTPTSENHTEELPVPPQAQPNSLR